MKQKQSYKEKLEALAREYEVPLRGRAWVQSRLHWEDWETLRQEAVSFAREEIRRRRWRGAPGGVLPGGQGGEDVADEAIISLLGGNCRLVPGFVREKVVNELRRLVRDKVRVLHGLKERATTRSEWEVKPRNEWGRPVSILRGMADKIASEPEATEEKEHWKAQILRHLAGEPDLQALFECLWIGLKKPKEIADRLGLDERQVSRARKRLERRLGKFSRSGRWREA